MRWLLTLVIALTVVPVASARVPNACTLLTTAQIKTALGGELQWRQPQGDRLARICTFHGRPYAESTGAHPTLTLIVSETTKARFKRFYGAGLRVPGIGELAYQEGGNVTFLRVFSESYVLEVVIPQDKNLGWGKRVATAALGRL